MFPRAYGIRTAGLGLIQSQRNRTPSPTSGRNNQATQQSNNKAADDLRLSPQCQASPAATSTASQTTIEFLTPDAQRAASSRDAVSTVTETVSHSQRHRRRRYRAGRIRRRTRARKRSRSGTSAADVSSSGYTAFCPLPQSSGSCSHSHSTQSRHPSRSADSVCGENRRIIRQLSCCRYAARRGRRKHNLHRSRLRPPQRCRRTCCSRGTITKSPVTAMLWIEQAATRRCWSASQSAPPWSRPLRSLQTSTPRPATATLPAAQLPFRSARPSGCDTDPRHQQTPVNRAHALRHKRHQQRAVECPFSELPQPFTTVKSPLVICAAIRVSAASPALVSDHLLRRARRVQLLRRKASAPAATAHPSPAKSQSRSAKPSGFPRHP